VPRWIEQALTTHGERERVTLVYPAAHPPIELGMIAEVQVQRRDRRRADGDLIGRAPLQLVEQRTRFIPTPEPDECTPELRHRPRTAMAQLDSPLE